MIMQTVVRERAVRAGSRQIESCTGQPGRGRWAAVNTGLVCVCLEKHLRFGRKQMHDESMVCDSVMCFAPPSASHTPAPRPPHVYPPPCLPPTQCLRTTGAPSSLHTSKRHCHRPTMPSSLHPTPAPYMTPNSSRTPQLWSVIPPCDPTTQHLVAPSVLPPGSYAEPHRLLHISHELILLGPRPQEQLVPVNQDRGHAA
jgi:hypothetical protein